MFALAETKTENPCSLDVRKALLNNVDLHSTANFSRKVGPLPDPDDLQLGTLLHFYDHYTYLIKLTSD